jgi:hypothetical protein
MRKLTAAQFAERYPDAEINESCLLNIACSTCGNRVKFRIESKITAEVTDEGTDRDESDCEWGEDSECDCECGEAGKLHRFTIAGLDDLLEEKQATKKDQ